MTTVIPAATSHYLHASVHLHPPPFSAGVTRQEGVGAGVDEPPDPRCVSASPGCPSPSRRLGHICAPSPLSLGLGPGQCPCHLTQGKDCICWEGGDEGGGRRAADGRAPRPPLAWPVVSVAGRKVAGKSVRVSVRAGFLLGRTDGGAPVQNNFFWSRREEREGRKGRVEKENEARRVSFILKKLPESCSTCSVCLPLVWFLIVASLCKRERLHV